MSSLLRQLAERAGHDVIRAASPTRSAAPRACPENVTPTRKELRLSDAEFERVFGMGKPAAKMPKWKQTRAKKSAGLLVAS